MKRETLEALLVDRELGELPCETVELLDAYLAQTPSAVEQACDLARAMTTARQAVSGSGAEVVPPFESIAIVLRRENVRAHLRRRARVVLQVAAAVALGIGLGKSWFQSPPDMRTALRDAPAHAQATETPAALWSHENFAQAAVGRASKSERGVGRHRLEWISPFKQPRIQKIP